MDQGATKYGTTGTYAYSQQYGFGVVDVDAALDLAENWTRVPKLKMVEACNTRDPNNLTTSYYSGELMIQNSGIDFIEYVEFFYDVNLRNDQGVLFWGGGPKSVNGVNGHWTVFLRGSGYLADGGPVNRVIRYADNQYLGTAADGTWKVSLREVGSTDSFQGWVYAYGVRIYGHGSDSEAATENDSGSEIVDYSNSSYPCTRAWADVNAPDFAVEPITGSVAENSEWTSPTPTVTGTPVGALTVVSRWR